MTAGRGGAHGLARFLHRAGRLKRVARTGWIDRGVPAATAESVADHSYRTALLAWVASLGTGLDSDRVLKLALLHDLAEALTGDLAPYDPDAIPDPHDAEGRRAFLDQRHQRSADRTAAKRAAEEAAMADLLADLPAPSRDLLAALWREVHEGQSAEARFVKQGDKLETYLQSREYLAEDADRPMASFAAEVDEVIDVPALAAIRDAVRHLLGDERRGRRE